MREYRFINPFRAFAAFWVLAAHVQLWGGYNWLPIPGPQMAVDLFMLVSGFLMAANASARWEREPMTDPSARVRFWLRRYFRIAPAYYLSLAVIIIGAPLLLAGKAHLQELNPERWAGTIYASGIDYSLDNVLMHVTFLFGLHPDYSYSTGLPDWSLSLEMQFYLAFPFLAVWLRRSWHMLAVGLLALVAGLWIDRYAQFPEPSFLLLKLNYFLAGMLLFRALNRLRLKPAIAALLLASLGFQYHLAWIPPALLLSMLALGWMEQTDRTPAWLAWIINSPPVRFASDVSYSVYLFHGMMIGAFGALLAAFGGVDAPERTAAMFAFVVLTSYPLAYVVYRWVELPGIALGKRLFKLRGPVAPAIP